MCVCERNSDRWRARSPPFLDDDELNVLEHTRAGDLNSGA